MTVKEKIVLCIPGVWESRSAFTQKLADEFSTQIMFAGMVLLDSQTDESVESVFEDKSSDMLRAFDISGVYDPLDQNERDDLAAHNSVVYLISRKSGIEELRKLCRFATYLCKAGGLGVKNEIAGKSYSKTVWLEREHHFQNELEALFYSAVFPLVNETDSEHFTVGMVQFGLPDAKLLGQSDLNEAKHLLEVFNWYRLSENPSIKVGHTFSLAPGEQLYRISKSEHPYSDRDYMDYSEGMLVLTPVN